MSDRVNIILGFIISILSGYGLFGTAMQMWTGFAAKDVWMLASGGVMFLIFAACLSVLYFVHPSRRMVFARRYDKHIEHDEGEDDPPYTRFDDLPAGVERTGKPPKPASKNPAPLLCEVKLMSSNEEFLETQEAYWEAKAQTDKAYAEAMAPANQAYDEALARADKAQEEALAVPTWKFWKRQSKEQIRQTRNDAAYRAGCAHEFASNQIPSKEPKLLVKDVPWYNYGKLVGYADLVTCSFEERQIGVCLSCKKTFWFTGQPNCHCGCGKGPSHAKVLRIRKLDNKTEDRALGPPPGWSGSKVGEVLPPIKDRIEVKLMSTRKEALEQAWKVYKEAMAQVLKAYDETEMNEELRAQKWEAYQKSMVQAEEAYIEAKGQAEKLPE